MHTKIGEKPELLKRQAVTALVHVTVLRCITSVCIIYVRVKEYIQMGLDKDIINPDNGANIAKKLTAFQTSGLDLNVHANLRLSQETPTTGCTSNLGDLPLVSFASTSIMSRGLSTPF